MSGLTPTQVAEAVRRANDVHRFPRLVPITRMDGSVGPIEPTLTQEILLWYFERFSWTYTDKYRQARSSVIHVSELLRNVAYTKGATGLIAADKEATYKELIRRTGIMYNGLPEAIRPPLSRPVSSESIAFTHDGFIQGLTGGGESPAIGFSPDSVCISEYGLFDSFGNFDGNFFPAINRRPNAKCRIETTPGQYNSPAHQMYRGALRGEGRFQAVFLSWWHDDSCVSYDPPKPSNFQRTTEEMLYAEKLLVFETVAIARKETWYHYAAPRPVSDEHLWFRRIALETEFHGDPRLFDNKYPPSPHEGWIIGSSPTIPAEPLVRLRAKARPAPEDTEVFYEQREPGCPYLITIDGTGYGKTGDPAAMVLWNMWDWREAGIWHGREDPGLLAQRALRWQKMYDADVIAETNKDGVAAALDALGCPKMFWSNGQPGWFSSSVSKKAALVGAVNLLRADEIDILSEEIIEQLSTWDGKLRSEGLKKGKHHWDLAICVLIFAYAAEVMGHQRRPRPRPVEADGPMKAQQFLAHFAKKNNGRVLGSPS